MRRAASIAAIALAFALLGPASAFAHVPILEEPGRPRDIRGSAEVPFPNAQPMAAPTKSIAVYGYLGRDDRLDAYSFTVPEKTVTTVEVLVPVRTGLGDFRPTLMVFSEGEGERDILRDPGADARERFYEPFSVASFYLGGSRTLTFEPGERYYFVVTGGQGERTHGAYAIGISGPEEFSATETIGTLMVLPTIWLGAWGGGPIRPGAIAGMTLLVVLLALGVWWWVRRRRRRAMQAAEEPPAEEPAAAAEPPAAE